MAIYSQKPPEVDTEFALEIDPVCGTTIEPDIARERDLGFSFAEREYLFCGPKCREVFVQSPQTFAAAGRDAP